MENLPNATWRPETRVRALYGLLICSRPKFRKRIDGNARQMASQVALAWRTILTIRLAKDSIWEKALTPAVLNDPQQNGTIWAACVLKGSCGSFRIGSPRGALSTLKNHTLLISCIGSHHVRGMLSAATFAVSHSKWSRMPRTLHFLPSQDGGKVPLKGCATLLSL